MSTEVPVLPGSILKNVKNSDLAALLKRAGMTQKELAKLCEVSPETVSRWMTGRSATPRIVVRHLTLMVNARSLGDKLIRITRADS